MIAGTHSGVGKTTVATGLVAALRATGIRPATAKVGPDFIDPGYHSLASGCPPRNLDPWLCGPETMAPLAARAAAGADVLVVEGVMGLFDGAADGSPSSTADVARLLDAPVLLVVDAKAMSSSVAAVVHGFTTLDPSVSVAGVVLNRVGSEAHERQLREAIAPLCVPVLGSLGRDDRLVWRDRHLGLVPAVERDLEVRESLAVLAEAIGGSLDLEAVVRLARTAPRREVAEPPTIDPVTGRSLRIGVATGRAFSFTYTETTELLTSAGAEVVPVDPTVDDALPDALDGLIIGGGFPEVFVDDLSANVTLRESVRALVAAGTPTWAECGGAMWLCHRVDGRPGVGVIDAEARMTERLTLGYRQATALVDTPLGPAGTTMRGHEFHYGTIEPGGQALELTSRWSSRLDGYATPTLMATFLHHHPAGDPGPLSDFLATCGERSRP